PLGLSRLVPSDLFDAVVERGRVAVGIVHVDVAVAARHVAPDALDRDLVLLEVGVGVHDLAQASALPGDLVDGDLGRELPVGTEVHHLLVEEHERVVIRAVAHEVAARIAEVPVLREPGRLREVERVGEPEAEQVRIELNALHELEDVEPEVAEPPDLEGPRKHHASDIVALGRGCHGLSPPYEARVCRAFIHGQSRWLASRAPSASIRNFSHMMLGCTRAVARPWANPQSTPAMTFSRPTTLA